MGVRTDRTVVLVDASDGATLTFTPQLGKGEEVRDDQAYFITMEGRGVYCSTADLVALRHHLAELIDSEERDAVSPAPSTDPWLVRPITDPQA